MAYIEETSEYSEGVNKIESKSVLSSVKLNESHQQLANRTKYLKDQTDEIPTIKTRATNLETRATAAETSINVLDTKFDNLEDQFNEFKNKIFDSIYPKGSIYMSIENVNPQLLFGGTWEAIQGRFLLSTSSQYSLGYTGGSADLQEHNHQIIINANGSHTHSRGSMNITGVMNPKVNASNISLTVDLETSGAFCRGAETGYFHYAQDGAKNLTSYCAVNFDASRSWTGTTSLAGGHSHTFGNNNENTTEKTGTGNGQNMPPYLIVNMWKRIG